MANGKITLGKQSGGTLGLVFPDGVTNTEVTLPDSGELAATENIHGFKNYIINGGFDVWQRGTSFNNMYIGTNTYHADRFASASTFSVGGVSITKSSITYNNIKYNSAKCTTTTAYTTSGANAAYRHFCYLLEGIASSVVNKGFTLSFLFNTNVAGTYTVSFRCEGSTASAYKTRITAVSGIQKIVITVPANTITTPNLDNNLGLQIYIGAVAGSSYAGLSTTLNQWDSIATLYYPNEMNWAGTVGNYIEIAQVQLEEGSIATPFEQRPYGLELALCRRYFDRRRLVVFAPVISSIYGGSVPVNIEGNFRVSASFSVNSVLENYNWVGSLVCSNHNLGHFVFSSAQQTTVGAYIDAICDFSAEL